MNDTHVTVQFWSFKHRAWWHHKGMGYSRDPSDAGTWTSLESAFAECSTLEDALVSGVAAAVVWGWNLSTKPHVITATHVSPEKRELLDAAIQSQKHA